MNTDLPEADSSARFTVVPGDPSNTSTAGILAPTLIERKEDLKVGIEFLANDLETWNNIVVEELVDEEEVVERIQLLLCCFVEVDSQSLYMQELN